MQSIYDFGDLSSVTLRNYFFIRVSFPASFLTNQTTTFESATSDKEVWNMSRQPLAVMATEVN